MNDITKMFYHYVVDFISLTLFAESFVKIHGFMFVDLPMAVPTLVTVALSQAVTSEPKAVLAWVA